MSKFHKMSFKKKFIGLPMKYVIKCSSLNGIYLMMSLCIAFLLLSLLPGFSDELKLMKADYERNKGNEVSAIGILEGLVMSYHHCYAVVGCASRQVICIAFCSEQCIDQV